MTHIHTKIKKQYKKGFTLIEILVVIGIIAILAGVVLVAVSPGRQFKQARDTQRVANVNTLLNAIGQNISDHQGSFFCNGAIVVLPSTPTNITNDIASGGVDIAECLVPEYLPKLPYDPLIGKGSYINEDEYNLGYKVMVDGQDRVSLEADGELEGTIVVTR